jgi:putative hydrolases of HD superfamily
VKILDFAFALGKLKKLKRAGWVAYKVSDSESVAEHSFRLAVLAMFLAPKVGANVEKSIKMALIHDIGEAEIGDIIAYRGKKKVLKNLTAKIALERKELLEVLKLVEEDDMIKLFDEYEKGETKEAKFLKQLDKLEMAIQAYEYEKQHKINLGEFFETTEFFVKNKFLKQVLIGLKKLRG